MKKIGVFVGSLRRDSINLKFAKALEALSESRFQFVYADLADVPMYNDDLIAAPPAPVEAMRKVITETDAVLFVIPEYNRTIPPLITNAIAWGSRPYGSNRWAGRPGAVVGASGGQIGTAVAQSHLRSIMGFLDLSLLGQPEVYFQAKPGLIAEDFSITDEGTKAFLTGWVEKFDTWIERYQAGKAAAG